MAGDPRRVCVQGAGIIVPIVVGGDEEVCAGRSILLARKLGLVVHVGRG